MSKRSTRHETAEQRHAGRRLLRLLGVYSQTTRTHQMEDHCGPKIGARQGGCLNLNEQRARTARYSIRHDRKLSQLF